MPESHRTSTFILMKKVLFMLAMLTCIFASCSDGGSEDPINPTPKPDDVKYEITIDASIISNGLSFDTKAGEGSISFTANANWTLTVASTTSGATWCKASATSGTKGSATVKFTVEENTGYEDRSVSVTIKAGTASKTFTIIQKGVDALLVTTNKYEVVQEGGTIEVEVKANIDYSMEISETAKGWISEASSRALKTYKHTITIAANEEVEKREGEIIFKSGDKVETVKVYQAGGAILLLSQNEYTVSDAGETISVDIKSNIEFGVQMPEVDWITDEASSRGMSSHTLNYYIAPNEGYDSRSAQIIFFDKNSDLKDTLTVVQAQKDAIVISEKNISVTKEGGMVEVKINTNVDFEVKIPSDATWISQTESRSLIEHTLYFKVDENTSDESRCVNITIINKDSRLNETLLVTQQGDMLIIKLEKSGFLEAFLEKEEGTIKYLKIIGTLNGEDINALKDYRGWIKALDLSEAVISGGTYRHYRDYGYDYIDVEDYTITRGLFDFSIGKLVLPRNIVSIKKDAIAISGGLDLIDLPESLRTIEYNAFDSDAYSGPSFAPRCINISDLAMWCSIPLEERILSYSDGKLTLNGSEITDLTIPEGLMAIGNYSFANCCNLESVEIHKNIESIGCESFASCNGLTEVNMGNGLTVIGERSFYSCDNLTNVVFSKSLTTIKEYAFYGCKSLQIIDFPASLTKIDKNAFANCTNLVEVKLPVGLTRIEDNTFSGCKNLKLLKIGENIEFIGADNFYSSSLEAVYCYSTNPPIIKSSSFKKSSSCKLYVPKGCKTVYESSEWNDYFYEIIEMD